jgi:hypothetical protein
VRVGSKAFRLVMKYAKPGTVSFIDLDGASLPRGGAPKWNNGSVTPRIIAIPVEWSKLVELIGVKAQRVAIANVVDETLSDAAEMLSVWRDVLLNTDGKATIGTIAVGGVDVGTNTITLTPTPFGARLIRPGQKVGIWNGDALRGTTEVASVKSNLGGTQTFTYVGADVAGAAQGDFIRVDGLTDGAPVGIYGLPYFHSTSVAGTMLGIDRSNPYVVSNGYDCGGAQISLPVLRLIKNQVKQRLGSKALKGQFFHTHTSQVAAYEELGFPLQQIPMSDGNAKGLDLLFSGRKSVDGNPIVENIHADQSAWDFVQPRAFGKVKFGDPPFWYEANGSKIVPLYDGTTGTPKTLFGAWLIDSYQMYCDNVISGGRLSNLKVPAGN